MMYLMGITLITVPDVVLAQDKSFNPWWASEDKVLFAKSMVQAACLELPAVQTLVSYCIACPFVVCLQGLSLNGRENLQFTFCKYLLIAVTTYYYTIFNYCYLEALEQDCNVHRQQHDMDVQGAMIRGQRREAEATEVVRVKLVSLLPDSQVAY